MRKSIGALAVAASLAAQPAAMGGPLPPSKVPRFWVPLGVGPVKGPPAAKVTIIGFMDYQSEFCLRASQTIAALVAEHPTEVRYQVIHRPLPFHRQASFAAKAALAAGQQGKFWEMHQALLANQRALAPADIEGYATKIGLDLARFKADLASPTVDSQAELEEANAQSLRVEAIPNFFLNGRSVPGAQARAVFEKALAEELAYADAVLKSGVAPADLYNTITRHGSSELTTGPRRPSISGEGKTGNPVFDAAWKVLGDNTDKVQACYDAARAVRPSLAGQVVVQVDIVAGHEPTVLLHESTMEFAKVDNCIVQSLKALSYPKGNEQAVRLRRRFSFPAETPAARP